MVTVNSQRDKKKIINYPPETLKTFNVSGYEWIDNLCFTIDPAECLDNAADYIKIAKRRFVKAGWDGDGKVELMWIPPFMLDEQKAANFTEGITVWHVKQLEDGISWILHPKYLFEEADK